MANILETINNSYKRTSKNLEQISLILFILAMGIFTVTFVNRSASSKTDNVFPCVMTPVEDVLELNQTPLKTIMQLSLINTETELFKTALAKNEVPAIENPRFGSYEQISDCIDPNEIVYAVTIDDITRIYPKRILEFHILINDYFNDKPVLITYSPLADLFQVFTRTIKDEPAVFGVSGYLYKNTDLIFDSQSESLWSLLNGKALVGSKIGSTLEIIGDVETMTLYESQVTYPDADYMTFDTGFRFDYDEELFADYRTNNKIIEDVVFFNSTIASKTTVRGFFINDQPYHIDVTSYDDGFEKEVDITGVKYRFYIHNLDLTITNMSNNIKVHNFPIYWFVWYDNYPKTSDPLINE